MKKVLNSFALRLHEIGVEIVIYLISLAVKDNFRVETVDSCSDALISEVGLKQFSVISVDSNVIHIDVSSLLHDVVKSAIEIIMKEVVIASHVVSRSVEEHFF